jgi:hypothetical protein
VVTYTRAGLGSLVIPDEVPAAMVQALWDDEMADRLQRNAQLAHSRRFMNEVGPRAVQTILAHANDLRMATRLALMGPWAPYDNATMRYKMDSRPVLGDVEQMRVYQAILHPVTFEALCIYLTLYTDERAAPHLGPIKVGGVDVVGRAGVEVDELLLVFTKNGTNEPAYQHTHTERIPIPVSRIPIELGKRRVTYTFTSQPWQ